MHSEDTEGNYRHYLALLVDSDDNFLQYLRYAFRIPKINPEKKRRSAIGRTRSLLSSVFFGMPPLHNCPCFVAQFLWEFFCHRNYVKELRHFSIYGGSLLNPVNC